MEVGRTDHVDECGINGHTMSRIARLVACQLLRGEGGGGGGGERKSERERGGGRELHVDIIHIRRKTKARKATRRGGRKQKRQ